VQQAVEQAPPPVEPPLELAEAEPVSPTPAPPAELTPVPPAPATIDAIEIDGSANYFAGAGPDGATVQLYVQNTFIAAAKVEGGRWLVEAQGALTLPVQRVRIDLIEPQQQAVSARAEVNFVIDIPPPAPDVTIAGTGSGAIAPAHSATGNVAFAPQVESELEVDPTIPTLRTLPAVAPEMMRFASGKAIIRRGETLWAIAARVYGDGSLYQHIVDANAELRRNPGRIYPGQVFDLPKLQAVDAAN
jgi:nucleoid-associated protein YgaU